MDIARQIQQGDRLALSRLLTWIENDRQEGYAAMDQLFAHTGKAAIIGITGPSGSGKSTLVNRLAMKLAGNPDHPQSIAILAIDPSSPFSGGALLGDRVRMRDLMEHPEIFIRSVATRGSLGGLTRTASDMVLALEAGGFDTILVETAGAGQAEVDIARLAHTTLVVESPGLGDDIQAAKAGILEIADILVVNKADKSGAAAAARSLAAMLDIGAESRGENQDAQDRVWKVPVLKTSALNNEGIDELAAAIQRHYAFLQSSGEWQIRSQARLDDLFERLLRDKLFDNWRQNIQENQYREILTQIHERKFSPYQALNKLFS
jgi:LAO/AO transport system kinase